MDRDVVELKLESLQRCVRRLETKCPADAAILAVDLDLQDIVSVNLTRAVQIAVDIAAHLLAERQEPPPATMGQSFERLAQAGILDGELAGNLKKAVGFRNIAVHSYEDINWGMVHSIVRYHLGDFSRFAKAIGAGLAEPEPQAALRSGEGFTSP